MSLECLKKAASSYDRLPLTPRKPPAAPTGIRAIQACLLSERRGIVALVRRLVWKKLPEGATGRARPGRAPEAASGALPELPGAQTFFEIFCGAAAVGALMPSLIDWNRWIFFNNPLCDDLLTIGVDSPEGGAYNPNH
jgi:hypothetical protein